MKAWLVCLPVLASRWQQTAHRFWGRSAVRANSPRRLRLESLSVEVLETRLVPTVTFHGGPVISNVHVETLFDGSGWNDGGTNFNQTGTLNSFASWVVNSPYMDMLSNGGYGVGRGSFTQGPIALSNLSSGSTQDSDVQNLIQGYINNATLINPDSNTLYMVYVQPGVEVFAPFGNSHTDFYGYHSGFAGHDHNGNAINVHYAILPYETGINAGPSGGFANVLDGMTAVSSHELAEAVTDPDVWNNNLGWYDSSEPNSIGGEIGDIFNSVDVRLDGWAVQKVAAQNDSALTPLPSWATLSGGVLTVTGASSDNITVKKSEFGGISVISHSGEEIDLRAGDVSTVSS